MLGPKKLGSCRGWDRECLHGTAICQRLQDTGIERSLVETRWGGVYSRMSLTIVTFVTTARFFPDIRSDVDVRSSLTGLDFLRISFPGTSVPGYSQRVPNGTLGRWFIHIRQTMSISIGGRGSSVPAQQHRTLRHNGHQCPPTTRPERHVRHPRHNRSDAIVMWVFGRL